MKKTTWWAVAVLAVALAAPVFAGSGAKCSYDATACLQKLSEKRDKGWMGIEQDKSADGVLSVKRVVPGSPAETAGFLAGDVLLTRNGIKLSDYEAIKADKASFKAGAKVTYTVQRQNAEKQIAVTLGSMPEDVFANMVGAHMIADHMVVDAAAAKVETPKEKVDAKTVASDK